VDLSLHPLARRALTSAPQEKSIDYGKSLIVATRLLNPSHSASGTTCQGPTVHVSERLRASVLFLASYPQKSSDCRVGFVKWAALQVFRGAAYNTKVDIFSATLIFYQIFTQFHISSQFETELDAYTYGYKLCNGYRPPIPAKFQEGLQAWLQSGWADRPEDRPTAAHMLKQLQALQASDEFVQFAGMHKRRSACCSCLW
jgi:hypothetical protein